MAITNIKISNFKSFKNLDVNLGKYNILIGCNASGKSNFIQIFKFIKDMIDYGLDNAILMQGGVDYFRNITLSHSMPFSLEFTFERPFVRRIRRPKEDFDLRFAGNAIDYKIVLNFNKRGLGFKISEEKLMLRGNLIKQKKIKRVSRKVVDEGEMIFSNQNGRFQFNTNFINGTKIIEEDVVPVFWKEPEDGQRDNLMIKYLYYYIPPLYDVFSEITIYDFDPKLPKKSFQIAGGSGLEEDGRNLALVIKNIIKDHKKKRMFYNIMNSCLPFIERIDTKDFVDKSMLFSLKENYQRNFLPSSLVSDGTINIIALIIALYFEQGYLSIIEEPERNIHPALISKVVYMLKEASNKKQIIVSTHNPILVKYSDLENLLLISRNADGFSNISKPAEKADLRTFLKNEVGIDELYINNLLGD